MGCTGAMPGVAPATGSSGAGNIVLPVCSKPIEVDCCIWFIGTRGGAEFWNGLLGGLFSVMAKGLVVSAGNKQ